MRKIIAVIGDGTIEEGSKKEAIAIATGKALVDAGYRVQSGGMGGIMRATFKGAKSSEKAQDGDTIALLPTFGKYSANEYADIVIPTGLDVMRNALVANASAVVAIGGGAGTLNEMSFAWSFKKLIIAYDNVDGWSQKLAGTRIDNKTRYENIPLEEDRVFAVSSPEEVVKILGEKIDLYNGYHHGIGNEYEHR